MSVRCGTCGALVPEEEFCSQCGAILPHTYTGEADPDGVGSRRFARAERHGVLVLFIAVGVLVVAVIAFFLSVSGAG